MTLTHILVIIIVASGFVWFAVNSWVYRYYPKFYKVVFWYFGLLFVSIIVSIIISIWV
jgi:threonine/homoserine/homoserine lactone efflux protein